MRKTFAIFYGMFTLSSFLLAVTLMNFQLFYGMQKSYILMPKPYSFFWDLFLAAQFPLLHSFLLTSKRNNFYMFNSEWGRVLSTTTYVLIASWQLIFVFTCWAPLSSQFIVEKSYLFYFQLVGFVFSNLFLAKSMFDAGIGVQLGLAGWTALYKNSTVKYPPMPENGCFKICRQPIYLSFTLLLWFAPTNNLDKIFLATAWTIYCLLGPLFKEARFKKHFGEKFLQYQKKVPYFLPFKL